MFISPAYAQATGGGANDMIMQLMPLVLIFVVFYFLLIRPQQKKVKTHRELLNNLRKGDTVVTGGGIMGKVVKLEDNVVFVEIADNVRIRVVRQTITDVVGKTEPVKEDSKDAASEAKKD
jgi:preprotein translocase subunit YajC